MDNNEVCIHGGSSPIGLLKSLHHSQAGSGRHKCPTCAYEEGFNLGCSNNWDSYVEYCEGVLDQGVCSQGSIAPAGVLENLGENQGGTGRHKCTNCAFKEGFLAGHSGVSGGSSVELLEKDAPTATLEQVAAGRAVKVDFVEQEIQNKKLGDLGELFVFQREQRKLNDANRPDLAQKVEHVAKTQGDGLGYDILSFDLNGNEMFIEVKTTRSGIERPIFITQNELLLSKVKKSHFFLYRLFDFDIAAHKAKFYVLHGNMEDKLSLSPVSYKALPKI